MKIYLKTKVYNLKKRLNTTTTNKKIFSFKNILNSKQIIKLFYGNIAEKQLKNLYKKTLTFQSQRSQFLIESLEKRLERVLIRACFTHSIKQSRQLICHRHVFVNNKIIKYPGYQMKSNDIIHLDEIGKKIIIKSWIKNFNVYKKLFISHSNFYSLVDYKRFLILFNQHLLFTTLNISLKNNLLLPIHFKKIFKTLPISMDFITRYYQLH